MDRMHRTALIFLVEVLVIIGIAAAGLWLGNTDLVMGAMLLVCLVLAVAVIVTIRQQRKP